MVCVVISIDVFVSSIEHAYYALVHKLKHNLWARTKHNFWLKSTMRCDTKCIEQASMLANEQSSESTIAHSFREFELYARTFLDTHTNKSNVLNSLANRVWPPDPVKSRGLLPSPKSESGRTMKLTTTKKQRPLDLWYHHFNGSWTHPAKHQMYVGFWSLKTHDFGVSDACYILVLFFSTAATTTKSKMIFTHFTPHEIRTTIVKFW